MKTFRLIRMALLGVFICVIFVACNSRSEIPTENSLTPLEQLYIDFENNKQIKCKNRIITDSTITLSGLNNGYIWYSIYEYQNQIVSKKHEWKDNVKTDTIIRLKLQSDNSTAAYYEDILRAITLIYHDKTTNGEINIFMLNDPVQNTLIRETGYQVIFTGEQHNLRTDIIHHYSQKFGYGHWYDDSYYFYEQLYNIKGEELFKGDYKRQFDVIPLSYKECIEIGRSLTRINVVQNESKIVWSINYEDVFKHLGISPDGYHFEDVKYINKNSNIFEFTIIGQYAENDIKYTFKVNIDTGKLL